MESLKTEVERRGIAHESSVDYSEHLGEDDESELLCAKAAPAAL